MANGTKASKSYKCMNNNILDKEISWFAQMTKTNRPSIAKVGTLLECIKRGGKDGSLVGVITQIRNMTDQNERNRLKRDLLPVITWQGTFSYKSKEGLLSLSGLMCIDIDHKPEKELERIKKILISFPWVLAFFQSPSGDGLKVIVKTGVTTPGEYEYCYEQVMDVFSSKVGCEVDKSCKEYSKGCYASYDSELYVNPDVEDFPFSYNESQMINSTSRKSPVFCGKIEFYTRDISSTESFLNQLMTQRNGLSDEQIIRILDNKFQRFHQNYKDGHRTDSIFKQAICLCCAGIPEEKAINYLSSTFLPTGYDEMKLINEVTKAYSKTSTLFGSERGKYKLI